MKNHNLPIVGGLFWILFVLTSLFFEEITTIDYIEMIVAFAILFLVPIIIRDYNRDDLSYKYIKRLHVPFGIISVCSFYVEQGVLSALLTTPWILITALLALSGLFSIVSQKQYQLPFPLLINVSHLLIVVGSGWLFLHRTGIDLLHFSDQIILLTAIHFHYAAFITPYIIVKTGKVIIMKTSAFHTLYIYLAIGTMIGIPIIATGITFNQTIEFIGMLVLVTTLTVYAIFQLIWGNKYLTTKIVKGLLTISCLSIITGMVFSFIYGLGHLTPDNHQYIISVEQMVVTHGLLNSIGFSLFGVLGCLKISDVSQIK